MKGGQCYYEADRPDSSFFEVDFSIQGRFFQVSNTGLGKSNFIIMLVSGGHNHCKNNGTKDQDCLGASGTRKHTNI